MDIYVTKEINHIRLHYISRYAAGSIPAENPTQLIAAIEEVCGAGSYCVYRKGIDNKAEVVFDPNGKYNHLTKITYFQQGVKSEVIERARDVAKELWGDIPEMKIGWMEDQCKTYIEEEPSECGERRPQKGDVLIATDPCVMESSGKSALNVGEEYTVIFSAQTLFTVESNVDTHHMFGFDDYKDFFRFK